MTKSNGYFLFYRSIWDNSIATIDSDYFITWIYILSQAEFQDGKRVYFGGKEITLKAGQFTIGIKNQMLNDIQKVQPTLTQYKLYRIIKKLKSANQIATLTDGRCSLFTVVNWSKYQKSATQIANPSQIRRKSKAKPLQPNELIVNKDKEIKEESAPASIEAVASEEEDNFDGMTPEEWWEAWTRGEVHADWE